MHRKSVKYTMFVKTNIEHEWVKGNGHGNANLAVGEKMSINCLKKMRLNTFFMNDVQLDLF